MSLVWFTLKQNCEKSYNSSKYLFNSSKKGDNLVLEKQITS